MFLKRCVQWPSLCCLLFMLLAGSARGTLAASPGQAVDIARIAAFVHAQMVDNDFPGMALALVHGDRIAYMHGFGEAARDGRPVTPQTPFVLGSVSKTITAVALMQLVEAGKVSLDAPVTRYLPWFRFSDARASRHITVRELLAHTSGIPADAGLSGWTFSALRTATIEQLVRSFRAISLDRPVGSRFEYADGNYIVISLIVQTVSAEPYGTYLQRHIFAPLHMDNSFTAEQAARRDGLAQGFTSWFGIPWPVEEPYLPVNLAAGYTVASVEDMAHLLIAEMNGGRYGRVSVLSPAGVAAMHTPSAPHTNYGMGWFVGNVDGTPAYWHDGVTLRFHAYVLIEPVRRWGAVLLVNQESLIASPALEHLQAGVAALLNGQEPPAGGPGVRTLALVSDGALLLALGIVACPLARLPLWYRRARERRRFGKRAYARVVTEADLPVLIVLGLSLLGLPWADQFVAAPDFTLYFLLLLALIFVTGYARGILIILIGRTPKDAACLVGGTGAGQPARQ